MPGSEPTGRSPDSQVERAVAVLQSRPGRHQVEMALGRLEGNVGPGVRRVLLDLYAHYRTHNRRQDAGGPLRARILRLLRPVLLPEDLPLCEEAVTTYEFLPPGRSEEAQGLRSSALLALNMLDEGLAGFHCVRLLTDIYTSRMSGEPALTAVRVLASQENLLPLYGYVVQQEHPIPEVLAACLISLSGVPGTILTDLVTRLSDGKDPTVLVGVIDLLIAHPDGFAHADALLTLLATTEHLEVYGYAVVALVASHRPDWIALLHQACRYEADRNRLTAARDALATLAGDPQAEELADVITPKLS